MRTDRKLLKDRIKLIKAVRDSCSVIRPAACYTSREVPDIAQLIREDKNRFVSLSQERPGYISFASKPEYAFDNKRRTRTSIGKFIRSHLKIGPDVLTDQELAYITEKTLGCFDASAFIRVLRGRDLYDYYNSDECPESCMKHHDGVQFYANNPEKVGLIVLSMKAQNGKGMYSGRSLLWTADCGTMLYDRIYPTDNGPAFGMIRCWAEGHGYKYVYNNDDVGKYFVTMKPSYSYPYIDSFRYIQQLSDGTLKCSNRSFRGYEYIAEYTNGTLDGGPDNEYDHYCSCCDYGLDDDEVYWHNDNAYCDTCYHDNFFDCAACGENWSLDEALELYARWGSSKICPGCAHDLNRCFNCDAYLRTEYEREIVAKDGIEHVCPTCADKGGYGKCPDCSRFLANDDVVCSCKQTVPQPL